MVKHIILWKLKDECNNSDVKIGIKTNEAMCILVINGKQIPKEKELVKEELILAAKEARANAIIGLKFEVCLAGGSYIVVYGSGTAVKIERV